MTQILSRLHSFKTRVCFTIYQNKANYKLCYIARVTSKVIPDFMSIILFFSGARVLKSTDKGSNELEPGVFNPFSPSCIAK